MAEAARAAAGGASSSGTIAAATDPKSGATLWLRGGEPVEVAAAAEDEEEEKADAAAAANLLSPAVAALSAPRRVDPWLAERFSAVRCGPLRVSGGTAGAAACLAELCGDGDDPGDAAFVVAAVEGADAGGSSSRGASRRPLLLAGDGPAPLSGSLLCPLLATPLASPPPPPAASLRSGDGFQGPPPAPTAVFEPSPSPSSGSRELVLDALALYPKTATAGEAAAALRSALSRQLRAAMAAATASSTAAASSNPSSSRSTSPSLRACPFLLPGLPVFVTPLMLVPRKKKTKAEKKEGATSKSSSSSSPPSSPSPDAASAARHSLGRALRLPPGLPMLRPSAAYDFDNAGKAKRRENRREKLLDVHLSLPSFSKSSKSSSAPFEPPLPRTPSLSFGCVAGSYRYHHYGQDSKDDRGWGCAYRSLQTLWSWFAENHFLAPPDSAGGGGEDVEDGERESRRRRRRRPTTPPSHAEIQRALVSVGDKPSSFIGSTQWIGALEISFALDELAGVQSKVITVARGSEMGSSAAAGALVAHFRTQGTPVMIGGGVLAYTCLGCCFDAASGEASFLILDPHYCGVSDDRGASDPAAAAAAAAAPPDADYLVIDINYFPGFEKLPDYEGLLIEFLAWLFRPRTAGRIRGLGAGAPAAATRSEGESSGGGGGSAASSAAAAAAAADDSAASSSAAEALASKLRVEERAATAPPASSFAAVPSASARSTSSPHSPPLSASTAAPLPSAALAAPASPAGSSPLQRGADSAASLQKLARSLSQRPVSFPKIGGGAGSGIAAAAAAAVARREKEEAEEKKDERSSS